jgi:preprotein translocase subunit SecG
MIRNRIALIGSAVALTMLAVCPSASAVTHGGEGIYGPTNDAVITNAMFIVMGFFVVIIIVFSVIQGRLEHRKHARLDAAKRRASSQEWKGGW